MADPVLRCSEARALRTQIEAAAQQFLDIADHLISVLDRLDGDPDREDSADAEPSLGAPDGHECQVIWLRGRDDDSEHDSPEYAGQPLPREERRR